MQVQIAEACGISRRALQGAPLSSFNVKERFAWARGRSTKKEEGMIHCVFGIFGCHMPPIYGEGREHALRRLHDDIKNTDKNKLAVSGLDAATKMVLAAL
jgi:hypothetical protein